MIIDAHAHLEPRMLTAEAAIAKMDDAGIDRVAMITTMCDPLPETPERLLSMMRQLMSRRSTRPLAELIHRITLTSEGDLRLGKEVYQLYSRPDNEPVARLIEAHPSRFFGWIFLNPRNTPDVLDELERWRSRPGMIGVKLHPHWHDYRTRIARPLLRRCEELCLPVMFHLGFRARGDFKSIAEEFPKLTLIAAHAGFPFFGDLWRHRERYPNLSVDLSSPYLDEAVIRRTVKNIGAGRCLYGTDSPYGFHGGDGSYDWGRIKGWIERLPIPSSEIDAILGGNFQRMLSP